MVMAEAVDKTSEVKSAVMAEVCPRMSLDKVTLGVPELTPEPMGLLITNRSVPSEGLVPWTRAILELNVT